MRCQAPHARHAWHRLWLRKIWPTLPGSDLLDQSICLFAESISFGSYMVLAATLSAQSLCGEVQNALIHLCNPHRREQGICANAL
jgi:hypothetical protein